MTKLLAVETQKTRSIDNVVECLERALERAKEGEIVGVALAMTTYKDEVSTSYSACLNKPLLIGAAALLEARMLKDMTDAE